MVNEYSVTMYERGEKRINKKKNERINYWRLSSNDAVAIVFIWMERKRKKNGCVPMSTVVWDRTQPPKVWRIHCGVQLRHSSFLIILRRLLSL